MRQHVQQLFVMLLIVIFHASSASALDIYGGPIYSNLNLSGYNAQSAAKGNSVTNSGIAVGYGSKYSSGQSLGVNAFRWDGAGNIIELGGLGFNSAGASGSRALAVNSNGTAVGYSTTYTGTTSGSNNGDRAVRWNNSGVATELGNLGFDSSGRTYSQANAVNDTGTAAGWAIRYDNNNNFDRGQRAVRWDNSGTAIELENLGLDNQLTTYSEALAINSSGVAVGRAAKFDDSAFKRDIGILAVRWDATGAVTELANLGLDSSGLNRGVAVAINSSGISVGKVGKIEAGNHKGTRPVRWDATGAITELGILGLNSSGQTSGEAFAINSSDIAVGYVQNYEAGIVKGNRAVRWDATGAASKLGTLDYDSSSSKAWAINDDGIAVGYVSGTSQHAVYWGLDNIAIDLQTMIADPQWGLNEALGISNDGWIIGKGRYYPLGGGLSYDRLFLVNINQIPVSSVWLGVSGDSWTTPANWQGGVPNSTTAKANFLGQGTGTVTVDTVQIVNQVVFNAATPSYIVGGPGILNLAGTTPLLTNTTGSNTINASLNLGNGTAIQVDGGTLAISPATANTVGTGVTATIASGATLQLGGVGSSLSSAVSVTNNGTLAATAAGKVVGAITGSGSTTVTAAGATLTANHVRQGSLDIGAGNTVTVAPNGTDSGVSQVTNLSIDATGKLDLTNNDLIVENGNLATLTAQLASGLDINGSYGNGPGITSSAFANNVDFNTVLGIAANVELGYTSFSGQTVDANDVLIKYTYYGDADLNGLVDTATDFDLYITGLTSGGSLGGWLYGDFDYNGVVDSATDFDLYITGLTTQGGPLLTAGGGGSSITAVPEPGSLALLAVGVCGTSVLLRRRRQPSNSKCSNR